MRSLLLIASALLAAACGPSPRIGNEVQGRVELGPSFTSIQVNVFTPACATTSCHSGNPPPNAPVSLDVGRAYDETVGKPSSQAPLLLVNPGDPEASYLLQKILGTAGSSGGVWTRMPIGAPPLSAAEIDAIETWIANGAPND